MSTIGRKKVEGPTCSKQLVLTNKLGMHARPAAMIVRAAARFEADIFVEKDGEEVNGKSIMGLMMLAAGPGSTLIVTAQGTDAEKAVEEIERIVLRKFDEE